MLLLGLHLGSLGQLAHYLSRVTGFFVGGVFYLHIFGNGFRFAIYGGGFGNGLLVAQLVPLSLLIKSIGLGLGGRIRGRRPGVVVPRRELLAEVWQQSYGDDQTIDVHLSWLRRKLGETAARPRYLHTLRGVGVKLEPPLDGQAGQAPR